MLPSVGMLVSIATEDDGDGDDDDDDAVIMIVCNVLLNELLFVGVTDGNILDRVVVPDDIPDDTDDILSVIGVLVEVDWFRGSIQEGCIYV